MLKRFLLDLWNIESQIRTHIRITKLVARVPILGRFVAMILDRLMLIIYGLDLISTSVNVNMISISHPTGVLLGGNGIRSNGRVAILAGAKFVGKNPDDPLYLEKHATGSVFELGDNVVIGAGSTIMGPVKITDNVVIGAMSLVNRDITSPGMYVGIPARKVSETVSTKWVEHL